MQIESIKTAKVATALTMFIIFASMSLLALGFPPKARLLPLLVGVPGTLLALFQLGSEMRQSARRSDDGVTFSATERNLFIWLLVFFLGLLGFGFLLAAPLLIFAFLYFGRKESLTIALISAAATELVLYGVFEILFEIPLFDGLVLGALTN